MEHFISRSGYPVFYYRLKGALTCQVQIVAKCGSAHEDSDSWGVAHFLEHMCFQGTKDKDKHQISREMALLGNANAYTNYYNTSYYIECLLEDFSKALSSVKEAVFDSCFPEKEFEKEKSVIVEEWRMYDNYPSEAFYDYVNRTCFGDEKAHPIIGTHDSIVSMNPEKLHRFRDKWYGKQNIFVVIVGDLDLEKVKSVVDESLPETPDVERSNNELKFYATEERYSFETERFDQSVFGIVGNWPSAYKSYENNLIPRFFCDALSKYMYEHIRDDLGLCYGVSADKTGTKDNSKIMISLLTNNKYIEKAEKELNRLFDKIKSEGFPYQIYEITKKHSKFNQVKVLDSVQGISSTIVNGIIACDYDWMLDKGANLLSSDWMRATADRLTEKDLKDFANEWLGEFTKFSMLTKDKE